MARKSIALFVTTLCILSVVALGAKKSTDRLILALRKRILATVVEELSVKGLDINLPDSSHRLPLAEAVRSRDVRAVMALLEQGALARCHEPGSGTTPLHLAFQFNLPNIARALLAHGADPNAKDRSGVPARKLVPLSSSTTRGSSSSTARGNISELISLYDTRGSMAFESAPGSWLKEDRPGGSTYYWSPSTRESRWTPPPSCAWQRVTIQGHPVRYINTVTGQQLTSLPPALSWTRLRSETDNGSQLLWYNWAVQVSSTATPAELPPDMLAQLAVQVNVRWYNPTTGQYSYTDPVYSTPWRELTDEATSRPYYFNVDTRESLWEAPEELCWVKMEISDTSGAGEGEGEGDRAMRGSVGVGSWAARQYFYNRRSGEVSWTAPASGPLAFVPYASEL
ncbi:hypothetical protein VOLCADRAFT_99690 [Volvox carteri f. nagariensis]|uniref:WW domain-containing protein n=1 Tax=Volvox carteri f. nagariensis TaxID=3068 RepID=D8UID8_VOLCA|nr:uncharacterized protein VOLCADRAFT_99690 [Volvox carteri f. nagariensis]EFJ40493.1 hypothetical protein VOLCADRAFT_99690 [Volvox carteri f. nagariensis]|eukprot:XP_002958417.1 hypothetical protein VOLCADRAFT_99690 [Volvox carteri f. nagariensis]